MKSNAVAKEILQLVQNSVLIPTMTDEDIEMEIELKIISYGKRMKVVGAHGMAGIVQTMRDQQKQYFMTKSHETLKKCKHSEKIVDGATELILTNMRP